MCIQVVRTCRDGAVELPSICMHARYGMNLSCQTTTHVIGRLPTGIVLGSILQASSVSQRAPGGLVLGTPNRAYHNEVIGKL